MSLTLEKDKKHKKQMQPLKSNIISNALSLQLVDSRVRTTDRGHDFIQIDF